jgi:hypothetical protein
MTQEDIMELYPALLELPLDYVFFAESGHAYKVIKFFDGWYVEF